MAGSWVCLRGLIWSGFFVLDSVDRDLLGDRRGDHNRLGLMVQATMVRYIGVLKDPVDVPWPVVEFVAEQLGIDDPSCVTRYTTREMTAYEHAWEIRKAYGFRVLEDEEVSAEFRRFLDSRAWTHAEGPGALFDHGVGWLRRNLVLLPGISVLIRLVAAVREAAADRMHGLLASAADAADPMLAGRLRDALGVPPGGRLSGLESWRRAPTRISGRSLVAAFDRVSQLSGLGVRRVDCSAVPANRMAALARYGLSSKAPTLAALAEPRRTATLLAATRHLEAVAIDEALDLFAMLMTTRMINPARQVSNNDRLASLPRLERASRMLALVNRELFAALDAAAGSGGGVDVAVMWAAIERIASRAKVAGAVATVTELVPEDDGGADIALRVALTERYRTVRPSLSMLGESPAVLAAVAALPTLVALRVASKPLQPSDINPTVVPPMWHRAVYSNPDLPAGAVDRDAYVVCVLEQLFKALRVRDVFASPALRWGDPRAQLLDGPGWEAVRPQILDGLGLTAPVLTHLRGLVTVLDGTWRQTVDRMAEAGDSAKIQVVPDADGRMRLSVDHLDALDIPASLLDLRARTAALLKGQRPRIRPVPLDRGKLIQQHGHPFNRHVHRAPRRGRGAQPLAGLLQSAPGIRPELRQTVVPARLHRFSHRYRPFAVRSSAAPPGRANPTPDPGPTHHPRALPRPLYPVSTRHRPNPPGHRPSLCAAKGVGPSLTWLRAGS
jgi:hypothetical protein